jgi:diadenosine tetraphosphate (Ap4A) HIT family hydrolase
MVDRSQTLILKMPSGRAVLGNSQLLPGYCLLIAEPEVPSLNDLPLESQMVFLRDMALLGRALQDVTGCARVNYSVYGNTDPFLHAHVFARYAWEEPSRAKHPVWLSYNAQERDAVEFKLESHGTLKANLRTRLLELMNTSL